MTAQPTREKPASTARRSPRAPGAGGRDQARPGPTEFDAHRWFERYVASHGHVEASDRLSGVPYS